MSLVTTASDFPDATLGIANRATQSGGAMFLAKGFRFIFLSVVNFLLINLLLPEDFGIVRYVTLIVGIANLLNELGLTIAIVQKEKLHEKDLWSLFVVSSLWGLLLYGIIWGIAPATARFFTTPELSHLLRIGALIIPVAGVTAVHRALLRRQMRFERVALIETIAAAISASLSVVLAFAGFGVWALVMGSLVFEGLISLLMFFSIKIPRTSFQQFSALRGLIFFGAAVVLSRLIDYLLGSAPYVLIGKSIGKEALGLFSVARDLAILPQMTINAVLGSILIATFSRIQNNDEKIRTGFGTLVQLGSILSMPVLLIMVFLPRELLDVICFLKKNRAWLAAAPLLSWLAAMGIVYIFTVFCNGIWIAQGKIAAAIRVSLLMFATTIVAILIGRIWGLQGICIALFCRAVIIFIPYMFIHRHLTGVPIATFAGAIVPSTVAGAFMAGTVLITKQFIPGDTLQTHAILLASGCLFGGVVYLGVLWVLFRSAVKQLVRYIISALPKRRGVEEVVGKVSAFDDG